MNYGFFECKFCNQRYVKEAQFKKHTCDLMERDTFVRTDKRGRFAFTVYKAWIKARGYQKPGRDTFIESRYYISILKFATFYYDTMLPDVEDYIEFMVEGAFLPPMWINTTVYEQYLVAFDDRVKPLKQAEITFKYLDILARSLECEPGEVFDYIYVNELVKLIQCRRFSPWVLLLSKRFHRYMEECDPDEVPVLETMVNEDIWSQKFKAWPKSVATIRKLTKELGI
jgi:hypothetical protein